MLHQAVQDDVLTLKLTALGFVCALAQAFSQSPSLGVSSMALEVSPDPGLECLGICGDCLQMAATRAPVLLFRLQYWFLYRLPSFWEQESKD